MPLLPDAILVRFRQTGNKVEEVGHAGRSTISEYIAVQRVLDGEECKSVRVDMDVGDQC